MLDEFVKAGAPDDILYLSRPHIGTFRLVSMVEKMRASIHELGGEVRFETRVDDIEIDQGKVRSLKLERRNTAVRPRGAGRGPARATPSRCCTIAASISKPSRSRWVSHRTSAGADRSQPLRRSRPQQLGAADYKVVHHCSNGRAVHSFCMCPGGTVVAATSEPAAWSPTA